MNTNGLPIQIGEWRIREILDSDKDDLVKYANNRKVSMNLVDRFPYPYTRSDADEWFRFVRTQEANFCCAISSETEIIGGIGVRRLEDIHRLTGEVGYWLGEPFWGKGIATLALRAFTGYIFEHSDFQRLQAGVFSRNPASCRVLEKAGYSLEGCMRRHVVKENTILDVLMYAVIRDDWGGGND